MQYNYDDSGGFSEWNESKYLDDQTELVSWELIF